MPRAPLFVHCFGSVPWSLVNREPGAGEIFNDYRGRCANFYQLLRLAPERLEAAIVQYPPRPPFPGYVADAIPRAARWFALLRACLIRPLDRLPSLAADPIDIRDRRIRYFHNRLAVASFESLEIPALIETYDGADTFFFIDTRSAAGDLDRSDLSILSLTLPRIKGRFFLAGYDEEFFDRLFPGAERLPLAGYWSPTRILRNY